MYSKSPRMVRMPRIPSSVVLPAPLGPMMANMVPRWISNVIPPKICFASPCTAPELSSTLYDRSMYCSWEGSELSTMCPTEP